MARKMAGYPICAACGVPVADKGSHAGFQRSLVRKPEPEQPDDKCAEQAHSYLRNSKGHSTKIPVTSRKNASCTVAHRRAESSVVQPRNRSHRSRATLEFPHCVRCGTTDLVKLICDDLALSPSSAPVRSVTRISRTGRSRLLRSLFGHLTLSLAYDLHIAHALSRKRRR